jgi:hypothetical protein
LSNVLGGILSNACRDIHDKSKSINECRERKRRHKKNDSLICMQVESGLVEVKKYFISQSKTKLNAGSCVQGIYANIIGDTVMKKFILTYARKIEEEKPLKYEKIK